MTRIGIMQGRLVPPTDDRIQCFPRENWAEEFPLAAQASLDCIEWIFDEYGVDANPISTDSGIDSMLHLVNEHGVRVLSVCADYFMDRPLVRVSGAELEERIGVLFWLMERCRRLGAERITLPFVDASRIDTDAELDDVVFALNRTLQRAEETGLEIHVESSLSPERFAELLERLPSTLLKVNYDSGNSSSLSYDPRAEFSAYGERVGSVHIKDRLKGGGTVPLGTGDADLPAVFSCLRQVAYAGDIIMQVARDVPGDEVAWAKRNRALVLDHLARAAERNA